MPRIDGRRVNVSQIASVLRGVEHQKAQLVGDAQPGHDAAVVPLADPAKASLECRALEFIATTEDDQLDPGFLAQLPGIVKKLLVARHKQWNQPQVRPLEPRLN